MLDDTGAIYLSLNYPNDLLALGLAPDYPLPIRDILVETANGRAMRDITLVMVNFKDANENFMGPWREVQCILNPGSQTRLSGMYLRMNLYMATARDSTGRLYIDTTIKQSCSGV